MSNVAVLKECMLWTNSSQGTCTIGGMGAGDPLSEACLGIVDAKSDRFRLMHNYYVSSSGYTDISRFIGAIYFFALKWEEMQRV